MANKFHTDPKPEQEPDPGLWDFPKLKRKT